MAAVIPTAAPTFLLVDDDDELVGGGGGGCSTGLVGADEGEIGVELDGGGGAGGVRGNG